MLPSELEELIEQAAREEWEELDLSGNELTELPPSIGKLKSLKKLILGKWDFSQNKFIRNKLVSLPIEISALTKLESLAIAGNTLKHFPLSITHLSNLQALDLKANLIEKIPKSITKLTKLIAIDLSLNLINKIPIEIGQLQKLQVLDLDSNMLEEMPEGIGHLTNLQFLNLKHNQIQEIPTEIGQLKKLQFLDLGINQIKEIPEGIRQLTNLQFLDLDSNEIKEIPEEISRLMNLQSLNLSYNCLSKISESITHLKNLEHLLLGSNQITEIPESITKLINIKSIALWSNQITEISEEITKLPKLSILNLKDNPINNLPLEVVKEGIESIREYFQQLETEGVDYLYEAKLLIVGEGGAGKTSLANKIINPDYKLCEEDSTKGIEVLRWAFLRTDGNPFNVNIWDFGGQEIYHSTHQYFLTKRSLYLLVADTRKEDTDFYYWLNVVELLSDNSPILIIKNEKQDRQREISNQLRSEFGNLKEAIPTNLANNRNLPAILTACKYHLSQLPHIGQTLPKTWVKVRHALENDPRNYISLSEYLQICEDNGFKERKNALQLSDYLHDLGICLHFQDDEMSPLYQTVILKPKWGTDAAYAVLDNPEVIRNFGRFSNKELAQIWSADEYTGMHSGLLELMKKFQLCYEIPQCKGIYIAPQLLTENQTEYDWDESENLILRYTYDFMPKGLVRQFIVAIHENIEAQNVWRSGVIIHKREYANTRTEVIENYGKREIKIRVSGKNKRDLLTIVIYELDKIHNSYKRLADKYQKLIPCNCSTCKGSQDPHFYKLADLKRRYEKRVFTVQCEISYEIVDVLGLIDDIGARSQLQDSRRNPDLEYSVDYDVKERLNLNLNVNIENKQEQTMSNQQPNFGGDYVRGDKVMGDKVGRDKIGTQINNSQNLAQAAKEIKELLEQLSEEYNPNTEKGQNSIKNEALKIIKNDSTLQQKIVNALKEGSVTALEEAINHPVAKIVIAATKGFIEG